MKRIWRRNGLVFRGGRPGVAINELQRASSKRSRAKRLQHFDLWNEIYDEYLSWTLSLLTVCYTQLKKCPKGASLPRQFFLATTILLFRVFSDLLAIRGLCRDGFDVAAKTLSRSTIEHIDILALIIVQPEMAREFNRLKHNKASNAFWHKHISRGKIWRVMAPVWQEKFGQDFDANGWIEWLYGYHDVLGMSVHPSFSGGMFSALALGSGSNDTWLGIFGDRADISADTFYALIIHLWKLLLIAPEFPFSHRQTKLAIRYDRKSEFHQHIRTGGSILFDLLVSMWHPRVRKRFFKNPDTTNIWPAKRKARKQRTASR